MAAGHSRACPVLDTGASKTFSPVSISSPVRPSPTSRWRCQRVPEPDGLPRGRGRRPHAAAAGQVGGPLGLDGGQPSHPFGKWVARNLKYRRVVTIAAGYAFGWEVEGGFQRTFEKSGGQVVQKLWAPLNVADWAPYLSQIKRDADAVFGLRCPRPSSASPSSTRTPGSRDGCR